MFFDCYYQSWICARNTGHLEMSQPKFNDFLIFPTILRSYLSPSAIREATRVPSLLQLIPVFVFCPFKII